MICGDTCTQNSRLPAACKSACFYLVLEIQIGAKLMTGSHNRFLGNRALSPETLMMGYGFDPFLSERSLKPPVFHTSTFVFRTAQDGKEFFELAYGLRQK